MEHAENRLEHFPSVLRFGSQPEICRLQQFPRRRGLQEGGWMILQDRF